MVVAVSCYWDAFLLGEYRKLISTEVTADGAKYSQILTKETIFVLAHRTEAGAGGYRSVLKLLFTLLRQH